MEQKGLQFFLDIVSCALKRDVTRVFVVYFRSEEGGRIYKMGR